MSLLITLIRNGLGSLIALIDFITRPRKLKRPVSEQEKIEGELGELTLYQFFACPFCIKIRRTLHKLNLPIAKRSVSKGSPYRLELEQEGGKIQVPCLRIEQNGQVEWMYESSQIIAYLNERFANQYSNS